MFRKDDRLRSQGILISLVCLVLIFASIFTDWLDTPKRKVYDWVAALYIIGDAPSRAAAEIVDYRQASKAELIREHKALQDELLIHKKKLQLMASIKGENVRLRNLLNASESIDDKVVIGEVINISPDPSMLQLIINRGYKDDIFVGQAVVDESGLLGQVTAVGERVSRVLLITDSSHALPVQINRNGVRLVAEGTGTVNELRLRYVSNTTDIQAGDILVSSGLGNRFPFGYPVANVEEVIAEPGTAFQEVRLKTLAQMDRSRYVLFIFDEAPGANIESSEIKALDAPDSATRSRILPIQNSANQTLQDE